MSVGQFAYGAVEIEISLKAKSNWGYKIYERNIGKTKNMLQNACKTFLHDVIHRMNLVFV